MIACRQTRSDAALLSNSADDVGGSTRSDVDCLILVLRTLMSPLPAAMQFRSIYNAMELVARVRQKCIPAMRATEYCSLHMHLEMPDIQKVGSTLLCNVRNNILYNSRGEEQRSEGGNYVML